MNLQEIFDKVVNHLREQGCRSSRPGSRAFCSYRGENGLKCAIGCLIPDNLYHPKLEGRSILSIIKICDEIKDSPIHVTAKNILNYIGYVDKTDEEKHKTKLLLIDLQQIHDCCIVSHWEYRFQKCAKEFNLKYEQRN